MTYVLSREALAACLAVSTRGREAAKIDEIVRAVCEASGVERLAVYSPSRLPQVARARQIVMYEAWQAGLSANAIGRALKRDHSTVLHGIRAEEQRRAAL